MNILNIFKKQESEKMGKDEAYYFDVYTGDKKWPRYNPDLLLSMKGRNIYRDMMSDEQIKAVVRFKRDAITSRKYSFCAYNGDIEDEKQKERIDILNKIFYAFKGSFKDSLNGIMTSMQFGFSLTEKTFDNVEINGKTYKGIKKLQLKPYDTFHFYMDDYGNLTKLEQMVGANKVEIDFNKFIHHVHNPDVHCYYGRSELYDCYRAYFSKEMTIRFMNIYNEKLASGFIWIEFEKDVNLTPAARDALKKTFENLQASTAVVAPPGSKLHYISPPNTDAYERTIALHDKAIAKALLVPNLLGITEQGNTGSYSQSEIQLKAFLWTLENEASRLEETINEQLVKQICDMNWGDGEYPSFKFEPLTDMQVLSYVSAWKDLVQVGAVEPSNTDEDELRKILGMPDKGEPLRKQQPSNPVANEADAENEDDQDDESDDKDDIKKEGDDLNKEPDDETIPGELVSVAADGIKIGTHGHVVCDMKAFSKAIKRVAFSVIDSKADAIETKGYTNVKEIYQAAVDSMIEYIKQEDVLKNPDKVKDVVFPGKYIKKINGVMKDTLKQAWDLGSDNARAEVSRAKMQRVTFDIPEDAANAYLESRAFTISGDMSDTAKKKVQNIVYNSIKGSWSIDETVQRIEELEESELLPTIPTIVRTSTFESLNEARVNYFTDPQLGGFVEALQYSAIIDGATTEICASLDGKIYPVDSPEWQSYKPPNHFNCRSILVAVTELDNWEKSKPPTVDPQEGFA